LRLLRLMFDGDRRGSEADCHQPSREGARWVGDRETVQRILALADELIHRARALARPDEANIRRRAREIWKQNGRPAGRDEEFWFQAEREIREAEKIANEGRDDQ
jgi:hypothetical protein